MCDIDGGSAGGTAGDGGVGGIAGAGGTGGSTGTGATGGSGGAAGGTGGAAGVGAAGGTGGAAGVGAAGGTGGAAGAGATGGTSGAAGAGATGGTGGCGSGLVDCYGDCVDTSENPLHCGGCGLACSNAHISSVTCHGGLCDGDCDGAWMDCDGNKLSNGCEVDGSVSQCGGPSCADGLDCGGVDCCENRLVVGGTFPMGRSSAGTDASAAGTADEQPEHDATIAGYYLDTFEVTVGRFRAFVNEFDGTPPPAGAGAHPLIADSGWKAEWNADLSATKAVLISNLKCSATNQVWTDAPGANEQYPMNCVDWYQAFAFCIWDGGRLPTEAEWEYAAAGGIENRLYPWGGQQPTDTHANFEGTQASPFVNVGTHTNGRGRWGHHDLAGGAWEWVFDWYGVGYYATIASCDNCANLTPETYRVRRGGGWVGDVSEIRGAARYIGDPALAYSTYGFRCARDL